MSSDGQDKTEKATDHRMKEVHREGRLSRSQDLTGWVGLGAAAVMLPSVISRGTQAATDQLTDVRDVAAHPDPAVAVTLLGQGLRSVVETLAPLFAVAAIAIIVVSAAQGGVHPKKFKLDFKHLNVFAGIKRMFSGQSWWQGAKTLLKSTVVGVVLYLVVQSLVPVLIGTGRLPLSHLLGVASSGAVNLMRWGVVAGILLAVLDVVVVMRRNRKQTRMSQQEVKEEHKRTEGDPRLKGAIRSKQMAMSRNRMMAAVATADVVLVNPTHVAVALRYEPGRGAPRVVAKGAGSVATRIREEAGKHRVPMVEDVPLARALHAACEVDQEIPEYLFTAVARVLAFVMTLRRRGAALGQHRMPGGSVAPAGVPTTRSAHRQLVKGRS